jgi:hypothetical protein
MLWAPRTARSLRHSGRGAFYIMAMRLLSIYLYIDTHPHLLPSFIDCVSANRLLKGLRLRSRG